jgi:hypothetical protein
MIYHERKKIQQNGYKKFVKKAQPQPKPRFVVNEKIARQLNRHADLVQQFQYVMQNVQGRSAMVVLPGASSKHDPEMFRPMHIELPRYRNRPEIVILTAEDRTVKLSVITSTANPSTARVEYTNLETWDFSCNPAVPGGVAQHAALLAAGNNLLQELVNTAGLAPQELCLPQLLIMTDTVVIDEDKLAALVADVPEELRSIYAQKKRESAEVISCGEKFGDAELMSDEDIQQAFTEQRAYEDYAPLLGAAVANPARKVLFAANPAYDVMREADLPMNWAETADNDLIDRLVDMMRAHLPLPEMATSTDLLDGLAEPTQPIKFSLGIEQLPRSAVVRAMRASFPTYAVIQHHVTDAELLHAAANPHLPLVVRAYSRLQVFKTEALTCLPSYAAGSLLPHKKNSRTVELA